MKHRFFYLTALLLMVVGVVAADPPVIDGCQIFPANNIWNTPIDTLPVDANSSAYINTIGADDNLFPDFGSGIWPPDTGGPIGIPYVTVPGDQPLVDIDFDYADESDPGPYPIPDDPPIEGVGADPDTDGDRHILILDEDNCILYEIFYAWPDGDGTWSAGSGAIYDLNSNDLRPDGWTSADAAGLPILPGLVRYDEVAAGEINHAIRFTVPQTRNDYVWPARHQASNLTGAQYPPMGQMFRLKADFDISGYSPEIQVIMRALKKYGLILADNGSAWYMSGVPDERWDNDMLKELTDITGADLEAVDVSSLIVDPNSGEAGEPGSGGGGPSESPTGLTVTGNLNVAPVFPTFGWTHQTAEGQTSAPGEWYNLYIADSNLTPVVDAWLQVGDVCEGVTCSYTLSPDVAPAGLLNGQHTWRVRAWANNVMTPYSSNRTFTVNVPDAGNVDNAAVNADTPKPYVEIVVDDDPGVSWYHLWIGNEAGQTQFFNWMPKPEDCEGGECRLYPFAHLVSGSYVVWMQTWGPGGFNDNDASKWSGPFDFSITFDAPTLLDTLTPTGTDTDTPSFHWVRDEGATWYHLWVGDGDFVTQFDGWFWVINTGCTDAMTCTVTPDVNLSSGTYQFWLQSWGPGGFSEDGAFSGWTEGGGFTVE